MKLIAVALPAGLVALALGTLFGEGAVQRGPAIGASAGEAHSPYGDALPPWHPPISGERHASQSGRFDVPHGQTVRPHWHPPLSDRATGLPDGHPVCPAGRAQLDRDGSRRGPLDAGDVRADPVISI